MPQDFPGVRDTLERWGLIPKGSPKSAVGQLGIKVAKVLRLSKAHAQPVTLSFASWAACFILSQACSALPLTFSATSSTWALVSSVHCSTWCLARLTVRSTLLFARCEAAAAGFCRELSERQKVLIDFFSEGIPKKVPEAISLCLFRVLQEAVQNALKHSGAKQFRVSLVGSMNEIQLTICDEGRGFDAEQVLKGTGLGLTSMKERLKLVDGELSLDTQLQRGTTIHARVPLRRRSKAASATTQMSQSSWRTT